MSFWTHAFKSLWVHQLTTSLPYTPTNLRPHKLITASPYKTYHLTNLQAYNLSSSESFFCLVFGWDFNIMSALFFHQSPTLPQKIDSREGWFWCKKGLVVDVGKMNIYLERLPFTPVFRLFATKCSAFCRKMQCNMPQNAVRFGAKCSVFWC